MGEVERVYAGQPNKQPALEIRSGFPYLLLELPNILLGYHLRRSWNPTRNVPGTAPLRELLPTRILKRFDEVDAYQYIDGAIFRYKHSYS